MNLKNLIKSLPLLSTLLLIIFLFIGNQKEYTKLRILIWNTPSLTLGTYLAISTGTGFILSYFISTNLTKTSQTVPIKSLRFKEDDKYKDSNEYKSDNIKSLYDNTLIERDIKDPSPTINASFRVIGRTERVNTNYINNNTQNDDSIEFEDQYDEKYYKNESFNQTKSISTDWNDESYSRW